MRTPPPSATPLQGLLLVVLIVLAAPVTSPASASEAPPRARMRLEHARDLAVLKLRRHASCRRLFALHGRDGDRLLVDLHWKPVAPGDVQEWCVRRSATMLLRSDSPTVEVCFDKVAGLETSELAATLLHEALHLAGVPEKPPIEHALTSAEITHLVRRECRL